MSPRRIAHLDMDAFFASVELLRYPELKGCPVVVGGRSAPAPTLDAVGTRRYARLGDYHGRGVVTTSTYEARVHGVYSAMGLMKAARLAPHAILLPADFAAYRHYSGLFKKAVAAIAPRIENRGIDEIYIDLSSHDEPPEQIGRRIKAAVTEATGLSCSIAISPNKLLSKIGSDLDKPDGLTILEMADIPVRIWPLPVNRINGIGPKANARLAGLGIFTIGDLAQADPGLLQDRFGLGTASWLLEVAHGRDSRPVQTQSEPKSISRETTFERDLHPRHDRAALTAHFERLCEQLAADLRGKGYRGRTIGLKLRFDDFRTVTRDFTLPGATADAPGILRAARVCLRRVPLERRIRLLGVRASKLEAAAQSSGADAEFGAQLTLC